jgi:hypothetical protein
MVKYHVRKTHKRKTHRSKSYRRRHTRRRGGACPCAMRLSGGGCGCSMRSLRGGRGGMGGAELGHAYTTGASQTLNQLTGKTPGLSN